MQYQPQHPSQRNRNDQSFEPRQRNYQDEESSWRERPYQDEGSRRQPSRYESSFSERRRPYEDYGMREGNEWERGESYQGFDEGRYPQWSDDTFRPRFGRSTQQSSRWDSDMDTSSSSSRQIGARHRGRGPKDYQRSDERIKEEVCDRLTDDDDIDAGDISVQVKSGEVHLTGTVSDRSAKRRAEMCVEQIPGVKDVINELRVQGQQSRQSQGQSQQSMQGQEHMQGQSQQHMQGQGQQHAQGQQHMQQGQGQQSGRSSDKERSSEETSEKGDKKKQM